MKEMTCIVVGGGYAGIHALKAIRKSVQEEQSGRRLRLVLLDPLPAHLRKVLLFKPAVGENEITVPWQRVLPDGTEIIQGAAQHIDGDAKQLYYKDAEGNGKQLAYDVLVVAVGSVARRPEAGAGGIALTDPQSSERIGEQWRRNMKLAASGEHSASKQQLMSAAVAGAGVTGIETAAELAYAMKDEAVRHGLNPMDVRVHLLNTHERLFREAPAKVGRKLERLLAECGVTVHHRTQAVREQDGSLTLTRGEPMRVGLTVWTMGLVPNPVLRGMNLPLTAQGSVIVDGSYRVEGRPGVYSIGDCAHIIDPASGLTDSMTCKEAIPQAGRLGRILCADLAGRPAPSHRKSTVPSFTIGLGPSRGLVWTRKWGLDMIITGKLAFRVKSFVWNYASMLHTGNNKPIE
ncbi:NAD(P)/FAD-dependent oxidoreductase [Paenibacillus kobensis]|uniref:NAD(P)/FAD-dependent oxidoreductase n=1 Tax=Paenibacillus kobensis TaxID=59841 RepID=UPI000FD862DE|nr:FAD-dependent oxidoreductase [Paenibacillus kobensis]